MRRKKLAAREQQIGQALIEFALVTPALLFITMAIIDFGRVLFTYAQASNQVREALRFGSLTQGMLGGNFLDCSSVIAVTRRVSFASDQDITVRYLDGQVLDATGEPEVLGDCGGALTRDIEQGDLLYIENAVDVPMITPFFPTVLEITFAGQRTIVTKITLTESEEDTDFDGLSDVWECYHFYAAAGYPDPLGVDEDGDDLCPEDMLPALVPIDFDVDAKGFEKILALYNATDDPDGDGCNNGCEETRTTVCNMDADPEPEPCFDPGAANPPPIWADSERDYTAIHAANFGWETPDGFYGPNDPDSDGDGLLDGEEAYTYGSDPLDVDSDDDGWDETACATAPGCPHNLEPEYTTGGYDGNGCHADDYEEAKGTPAYLTFPAIPPSSSRTAHSDDDPATDDGDPGTTSDIEDGVDDWTEICVYHTDPSVINSPTDPPTLVHSEGDSLCDVDVQPDPNQRYIGLAWSVPAGSFVDGFELYKDGTLIGTFPGTATSCTGLAGSPGSCYNANPGEWSAANMANYTIKPLFGTIQGPASNIVTVNCAVSSPLGVPTLTATPKCDKFQVPQRVEFTWTPVSGIDNYYFYVNGLLVGILNPLMTQCATVTAPGYPLCFTNPSFNWVVSDTYDYQIRAYQGGTVSSASSFDDHQCLVP